MRLDNKVSADMDKIDKGKFDENEIESQIIVGFVTLTLQLLFFLAWALLNLVLVSMYFVL